MRFSISRGQQLLVAVLASWALCGSLATAQPAATALDDAGFQNELARLDGICAKLDLVEERKLMSKWMVANSTDAHLLFLPIDADPLSARAAAAASNSAHANWLKHFTAARSKYAQHWYELSQGSSAAGDEWAAYNSLWRAAREDSSHAETKRVLGTLLTALNVKGKPRPVATIHPKFGWPAGSYSRMETANFKISSRADAAETQKIAVKLEAFYALWTQAFYPLWAAPGITTQRLSGRSTNWQRRQQVDVVLCKNRDDYLKTLGVAESNIGVSVGYYSPEAQMSFFYPDASLDATLYHELTHQLLAEASQLKGTSQAGDKTHFWLIEAVALYMESLVEADHHWRLGGWLAPRMQGARYRALHDGYWIEPKELDGLGASALKERDDIARVYTHAAGMAHFFMDRRLPPVDNETAATDTDSSTGNDSASAAEKRLNTFKAEDARAAFFASLIAAYRGDTPPDQFWHIAGDEHAHQDYLHFQIVRDRHIDALKGSQFPALSTKELVLARSRLIAASWQAIGQFKQLTWLDLSSSNAVAADLKWLKELSRLERLSLELVDIDRELITEISKLPRLKELDLSGCKLADEMLVPLKHCTQLETLWLSGNAGITSTGIAELAKLPKLKFVALDDTSVSAEEEKALNERLKRAR